MSTYPSQQPEYRKARREARKEELNAERRARYAEDHEYRERLQANSREQRRMNPEAMRLRDMERKRRSLVMRAKLHIGKCLRCGYSGWVGALQWAHVDASTKESEPSWLIRASDEKAFAELVKCVLICANCHWEEMGGLWKPNEEMHQTSVTLLREAMTKNPK